MEMTRLEKRFVNLKSKGESSIELLRQRLNGIGRVLRAGGYFTWLDLAFPSLVKKLLQPWSKTYGIYALEEVRKEIHITGLSQLFYEKLGRGFFAHHHLVLQKATNSV